MVIFGNNWRCHLKKIGLYFKLTRTNMIEHAFFFSHTHTIQALVFNCSFLSSPHQLDPSYSTIPICFMGQKKREQKGILFKIGCAKKDFVIKSVWSKNQIIWWLNWLYVLNVNDQTILFIYRILVCFLLDSLSKRKELCFLDFCYIEWFSQVKLGVSYTATQYFYFY